jgi:hypothetical protein
VEIDQRPLLLLVVIVPLALVGIGAGVTVGVERLGILRFVLYVLAFPGIAILGSIVFSLVHRVSIARQRRAWSRAPRQEGPDDWGGFGDGGIGSPLPWPSGPRPGLSERGPRQRGPRAEAATYAEPAGGR